LTGLTAYGCRADSRLWFTGIFLALAPALFVSQASILRLSCLLLVICSLYAVVKLMDKGGGRWLILLIPAGVAAIHFDIRLAGLLLPVSLQIVRIPAGRKKLWHVVIAILPAIAFAAVAMTSKSLTNLITAWNFASLTGVGRPAAVEEIPGFLYIFYPVAHPWFCVLLPGLLLLFRKTDLDNPARRMLLGGAVSYLLLLGGLPDRELFSLVPAYMIFLTVVFPSWDRIYCYGLYFFKKTVWLTVSILILTQVVMIYVKAAGQVQF
ncbi:MAG: hypothetical protein ACKOCO_14450, partial [Bacteroidota bacterium]